MVLGLKLALVPARKCPFEARIDPLLSLCKETRRVIPLFYWFLLVMATRKTYLKEEKNPVSRSCIFFYKNDVKCHIWRHSINGPCFKLLPRPSNWKSLCWKIIAQISKRDLDFSIFHRFFFCTRMIFDGCLSFEHSVRNLAKTLRITGSRGEIKQGDSILLLQIFNVLTVNWTKF